MMLVMTPLILAMLVASTAVFVWPAAIVAITVLHRICVFLNDWSAHASGFYSAPPAWVLIVGGLAALAVIALMRKRALALVAIALLCVSSVFKPVQHRDTEVTALDVGQGDSIVIRAGDKVLLVDGGPKPDGLVPMLVDRGIHRINVVALSHAHPDHCGGLPAVIENLDVGAVWITPRRFRDECAQRMLDACIRTSTPVHIVRDNDRLALGPIHATAMTQEMTFRRSPENNSSLVLRVQLQSKRVLLTGDVEREAESALLDRMKRCDILKVAHHGSRTSSTEAFLDAVRPHIALISCGHHNLFGHPHPTVIDALRRRGVRVWRTDQDGTVTVTLN
jgi:competence protein ComEC